MQAPAARPAPAEPVSYAAGSADDFAVIDDNEDLHSHIAADGKCPDTVFCLFRLFLKNQRSHADGEFVDLDPYRFGRKEMPAFVDDNQYGEND